MLAAAVRRALLVGDGKEGLGSEMLRRAGAAIPSTVDRIDGVAEIIVCASLEDIRGENAHSVV